MAEWRTIEEYPGYKVSDDGQVFSMKRNKLRMDKEVGNGYKQIALYQDGQRSDIYVHRLVYEAFVGAIPNGYEVNHKDEDKGNNRLDNLELLTRSQNCNYGTRNTRIRRTLRTRQKTKGRAVFQYTLDGILVRAWETMADAHDNGFDRSGVCNCCRGRLKTHKGYLWSYN